MTDAIPAVVIGANLGGLGAVRSLWNAGIPTFVVDSTRFRPAMWSRSCKAIIVSQLYGGSLVDALLDLRQQIGRKAVLISTDELATETLSMFHKQLDDAYFFRLPAEETFVNLYDKARFHGLAVSLDLRVPSSLILDRTSDLSTIKDLHFPVVVKPATKKAYYLDRGKRICKATTFDEAVAACNHILLGSERLLVQEWIEGSDSDIYFCLFYRGKQGKLVSVFTGQKLLSHPAQIGGTAICVPAQKYRSLIEAITTKFAEKVDLEGFGSLEFKWSAERASFFIIEPTVGRLDWQEEIATLCGINIPAAAYCHELDLQAPVGRIRDDVAWRTSFLRRWPTLQPRPRYRVYDGYWRLRDPGPAFFYYLLYCSSKALKKTGAMFVRALDHMFSIKSPKLATKSK